MNGYDFVMSLGHHHLNKNNEAKSKLFIKERMI